MTEDDRVDDFVELMGSFGSHSNLERRGRAELRAALKPEDRRRRKAGERRDAQIAVRIRRAAHDQMAKLCKHENWSQADMIEALVAEACKKRGIM